MPSKSVPTLYDWLKGMPVLDALMKRFYERVLQNELLRPLFAEMPPEHPHHVAQFLAEVLGGPKQYSEQHGGHANMLAHHFEKKITEAQRQRWVGLLLECADEMKLPDDPEFRSALVAYLEWGSRLAVINSHLEPGAKADSSVPMPSWNWGVPGGPYIPD